MTRLSPKLGDALKRFSGTANKHHDWLQPLDEPRWAGFIVLAHQYRSKISPDALKPILIGLGWREEAADDLARWYGIGRLVLARRRGGTFPEPDKPPDWLARQLSAEGDA